MNKNIRFSVFVVLMILSLTLSACNWFRKPPTQETIFDKLEKDKI